MSYIIVGGGIAGLYSAYSLNKKLGIDNIVIVEKNDRLGGRIQTLFTDNIFLELGAGGIMDNQENVIQLLLELGLENKIMKGSNGRSLLSTSTIPTTNYVNNEIINQEVPTIYQINSMIDIFDSNFYDILDNLNNRLADKSFYQLALSYNLFGLIEKYYGTDKADQLMYQFGYRDDFHVQNSINALAMFQKEFAPTSKFHQINGGMIQIINKLEKYLSNKNIPIMLNHACINITKSGDSPYHCELTGGKMISAKNIIFAIPKKNILKIKYLESVFDKLDTVIGKPLIRIYAFFPLINGKVWFDFINMTLTTKTLLSQIIPMDKSKGLLMIYCDSQNATTWDSISKQHHLEMELMYHLTKLFSDINIPTPLKIITSYHEAATHVWKPSVDPIIAYEEASKPFRNEDIYVVGEAYSLNQQWSSGAISSVSHMIDIIINNLLINS